MAGFEVEVEAMKLAATQLDTLATTVPDIGATVVTAGAEAMVVNETYVTGPAAETLGQQLEVALGKVANSLRDHGERLTQNATTYEQNDSNGHAHFNAQLRTFGTNR